MQYNEEDWFTEPFSPSDPKLYRRNLLQERFVHLYYKFICEKRQKELAAKPEDGTSNDRNELAIQIDGETSNNQNESPKFLQNQAAKNKTSQKIASDNLSNEETQSSSEIVTANETNFENAPDNQNDFDAYTELERYISHINMNSVPNSISDKKLCAPCRRVLSVGPESINDDSVWPSNEAEVLFY